MKINEAGLILIKEKEGLRLKAYKDQRGIWTIGYGHTGDVIPGQIITLDQADKLLLQDVSWAEDAINNCVNVSLTKNQFSALVSLVYNIGIQHFRGSSVVHFLNLGNYTQAADHFLDWHNITVHGHLQDDPGLDNRREQERALFLTPDDAQ